MNKILFLAALICACPTLANMESPLKADYIDFSKLNLNEYVEQKKPDIIIEKNQSQEDPKITTYFVFEKKINDIDKRLIMQAFDLNGDGKIDIVKHLQNGKVIRTEISGNKDGRVDEVTDYDPATGEILKKTLAHGATNTWEYWYKGELRLREVDRNNDHKPDMWIHYRKSQKVKTEVDANYDGRQIKEVK